MLLVEAILALLAIILAFVWPGLGAPWFERFEVWLGALAQRRGLAVLVVGASTLLLRLAVLPVEPIPNPSVHDEFSYLLQADTFAHGRLTNPTPAMWEHFETFHEIFQPTYCSKFFPGQGLFLALGKVLLGHPFWGVWLTSGLMCAAITWMLQGWFSAEWALLGGAIAMLRFGVFGYWANSYWGGNVAAIGGALVLGALPRIKSALRWQDATLMGIGLALMANSRPWEGLVLSLPIAVILLWWVFGKSSPPFKDSLRQLFLPLLIVLALTGGWLAHYCWRTTGSPVRTPYQVYEERYTSVPIMIWQGVRPQPTYRHDILAKLEADQETTLYQAYFKFSGQFFRIYSAAAFFWGPILILPFGVLFLALPKDFSITRIGRRTRELLILALIFAAGTEASVFYNPHYSAPATCLIIAMTQIALQKIRTWNRGGLFLSRAVPMACMALLALRVFAEPFRLPVDHAGTYYRFQFFQYEPQGWFPRAQIESQLENIPGNHIVIVRYGPEHPPFPDWVYNHADIDHARVIWARDMSPAENRELLNYYKGRAAWLLESDFTPPKIGVYDTAKTADDTDTRTSRFPSDQQIVHP
jgi:hypothetical protein